MSDPYGIDNQKPMRPLECIMEETLVDWLKAQAQTPDHFLADARVLAGHRDAPQVSLPEDLEGNAAKEARQVQVVVWCDNHRETYDGASGTDQVTMKTEIMANMTRVKGGQLALDHAIQGLRALLSRAWHSDVRDALNAVEGASMYWQGWHRDPAKGTETAFNGSVLSVVTEYEASGFLIPTENEQ